MVDCSIVIVMLVIVSLPEERHRKGGLQRIAKQVNIYLQYLWFMIREELWFMGFINNETSLVGARSFPTLG